MSSEQQEDEYDRLVHAITYGDPSEAAEMLRHYGLTQVRASSRVSDTLLRPPARYLFASLVVYAAVCGGDCGSRHARAERLRHSARR